MTGKKQTINSTNRCFSLLFIAFCFAAVAAGCSTIDPVEPSIPSASDTDSDRASDTGSQNQVDAEPEASTNSAVEATAVPTATPLPTIDDEELASATRVERGAQVEDVTGNLVAIYGIAEWPTSFDNLPDQGRRSFPFPEDLAMLADPNRQLLALDIGLCSAGVSTDAFATVEFSVHLSGTDPLVASEQRQAIVMGRPITTPGFRFPSSATCSRGTMPLVWSQNDAPTVARYVLTVGDASGGEPERHLYEWDLNQGAIAGSDVLDADRTVFEAGETVTFNAGRLEGVTVEFGGWAELIGTEAAVDGTRLVGVWVDACYAGPARPEVGLAVDGWNVVAPNANQVARPDDVPDPEDDASCVQDWVEFTVPFGGVPTSFFVSDGVDPVVGYAEWTLEGSARPWPG